MPFEAPATVASQGGTGYLATFELGDTYESPIQFTLISELKSINPKYAQGQAVDVTHLLSPNSTEEPRPGLLKPGTVAIRGNFIGDASQLALLTAAKNNAAQDPPYQGFRIKAPIQNGTKTYTATGYGFIMNYSPDSLENNKAVEFSADLQIVGPVTESVA